MTHTLVIDTSYGSTVGLVGHRPIIETDSRTHVERLQVNIAKACEQAGIQPSDLTRIIVGTGPGPFTGLRAGIVTAKALAFATGAQLIGQNILDAQALLGIIRNNDGSLTPIAQHQAQTSDDGADKAETTERRLILAVNDARRRQLYFELIDAQAYRSALQTSQPAEQRRQLATLIRMDIDYPDSIVQRVNQAAKQLHTVAGDYRIDIIGHGAQRYSDAWNQLEQAYTILDASLPEQGKEGLQAFAELAITQLNGGATPAPAEPLYLRRPDVSVPNPLKHVLNHGAATAADTH
ncbi:tRNA (adenosine(37)-N6)-threonylcarbamoyltransferase complex dimerization subunit type 1 TsaB [Bifidobacterium boum]|uniref:Putative glycoprotease n=1 Tax=Bifidobacterium boum TaxID=78343 RepID=A0A086ZFC1_9BIFI|nr:tRNA (adenosine(37)-N6)-threonylcarbamoyltransferase complex dimerization subunit type 1 TsaB [Bifidobacterium boum]KFI45221.1 putative glycoprotease [Bifidobacterium boum]